MQAGTPAFQSIGDVTISIVESSSLFRASHSCRQRMPAVQSRPPLSQSLNDSPLRRLVKIHEKIDFFAIAYLFFDLLESLSRVQLRRQKQVIRAMEFLDRLLGISTPFHTDPI